MKQEGAAGRERGKNCHGVAANQKACQAIRGGGRRKTRVQ